MMRPDDTAANAGDPANPPPGGWPRFVGQLEQDARFWLCAVGLFWLFRWLLIFLFRSYLGHNTGLGSILWGGIFGARFDISIATYATLPLVLLSAACGFGGLAPGMVERVRRIYGVVFFAVNYLLLGVNVGFIAEYKDNFNHWIYGLVFDDRQAIVRTVWKQYPVVRYLIGWAVLVALSRWGFRRLLRRPSATPRRLSRAQGWHRTRAAFCMMVVAVWAARGSLGSRPLKYYDAFVTQDDFLNKLVLNPYVALKYAINRHQFLGRPDGWKTFFPDGTIRDAARLLFPDAPAGDSLDEYVKKIAPGSAGHRPRHIFLVLMESYDAWPMLPAYRSLDLTAAMSDLARRGIRVKAFLPAGDMTITAIETLITGLPSTGMNQGYQISARHPFPTSVAPIFKQLGYTTRFFNGGYAQWNRLGDFGRDQGFDEVYSAAEMANPGKLWEWGVDDAGLYPFVLSHVPDDKPSFNLVLTTSYHAPYPHDVFAMGYPHREIPTDLKDHYSGKVPMKAFGHLWYADRLLGQFVARAEKQLSVPLFAFTGDHWGRIFLNEKPTIYEKTAVSFVLHGEKVLAGVPVPPRLAGAHLDIVPTLIELTAPAGFTYHSFGQNMLAVRPAPAGYGQFAVITPDLIFRTSDPSRVQGLDGAPTPDRQALAGELDRHYRALEAVGWWYLVNGPKLPPQR